MAVVELRLPPLPAHVRTARLVAVAAARRAGLDAECVDELRLALGEACSRAVGLHLTHAPQAPVTVTVQDDPGRLTVVVTDSGPGAAPVSDDVAGDLLDALSDGDGDGGDDGALAAEVSLAVVTALVDDVSVVPGQAGTTVTMRWTLPPRS